MKQFCIQEERNDIQLNALWYFAISCLGKSYFQNVIFLWANELTHCGLVTYYGAIDLGQHWLRHWLDDTSDTKQLPEPMLTYQ